MYDKKYNRKINGDDLNEIFTHFVCELASNIHTNFMIELILLFAGTIAIGGVIGFLASIIVVKVRKQ